jgi:hypothetical protein
MYCHLLCGIEIDIYLVLNLKPVVIKSLKFCFNYSLEKDILWKKVLRKLLNINICFNFQKKLQIFAKI